jgi:DUF1365 family protein
VNALYPVLVTHTRIRPRPHALSYQVPYLLLDLDAPPRLKLFSRNRFNLVSFRDSDHGNKAATLRNWVDTTLREAGLASASAHITLLSMPRVLGLGFNPLSLFLCHTEAGALRAVIYEVNNTFGQRHSYLCPVEETSGPLRQGAEKVFYVSPFMDMGLRYRFTLHPPSDSLGLHIAVEDAQGVILRATMAGRRAPLTDAALLRLVAAQPWLGVKVLTAIHWEALKIWCKGLRPRPRPPAPDQDVSQGYARPRRSA